MNTTDWSNMDAKGKYNTKYVDLEEDQIYEAFNLTKILTITFYDSFSIFIILSLFCNDNLIVVSSLKDDSEDDEKFTFTKPVDFIAHKVDVTQPSQSTWAFNVDCTAIFKQCYKTYLPDSLYAISDHEHYFEKTLRLYQKTLTLYQSPMQSILILQKTLQPKDVIHYVNQMYDISSMIHYIINHNAVFNIKKCNCSSSLMCTVLIYRSSDTCMYCSILQVQGCFHVDTEINQAHISLIGLGYVDTQHLHEDDHGISIVSIIVVTNYYMSCFV